MTAPDAFGPRPQYADLPVADLAVDSSYQRSIEARRNQAAIERICETFRWSLFGMVMVTKSVTGYLIIDGQHRTEAARRLKIKSVPCLIVPPLSRQDQALAFVAANRDRVAVSSFAIHHALAAAGDATAVALQAMCAAADVEVPHYPVPAPIMKPRQTLAIGALTGLLESRGHERAVALLSALRRAFPDDRGALRAPTISALAVLEPVDADAVAQALGKCGLKAFERLCVEQLNSGANSKTRTQAAVTVISRLIGRVAAPIPTITPSVKPAPKPAAPPPGSQAGAKAAQADRGQRRPRNEEGRAEPGRDRQGDRQLRRDQGRHEMPAGCGGADAGHAGVEVRASGRRRGVAAVESGDGSQRPAARADGGAQAAGGGLR